MNDIPQIFLNLKKSKHFSGQHPWVLDRSIVEPTVPLEAGQTVELLHPKHGFVGRGVYNPHSKIRVRLYQWNQDQTLNTDWVIAQLDHAYSLRERWFESTGMRPEGYRLVNSEGDGLSGLVIDQFSDYSSVQINSLAAFQWHETILEWLSEKLSPTGVLLNIETPVAKQEGLNAQSEWVAGNRPADPVVIHEAGVRFEVDFAHGQKTGYYLDQRRNRIEAAAWFAGGSLLDAFCYHGGFFLHAAKQGRCDSIVAVDSSQRALAAAKDTAERNQVSGVEYVQADCFDYLKQQSDAGRQFSNVVLDPPKMAGNRQQLDSALRAYFRLNHSAIRMVEPGGILVTCSCSGRIERDDFWGVLASAAQRARRRLQVLDSRGADVDHPVDINCPESEYLKCFICRVI